MTDLAALVASLKRPSLLIRAARHGVQDYDRNRDLRRLLKGAAPSPREAVAQLVGAEEAMETARRHGGAAYSVARHVDLMIAMLAELRLISRQETA